MEQWRNIIGYEGYYEISNFGRVKTNHKKTNALKGINKIKKQYIHPNGHLIVGLNINNIRISVKVHRLVAIAFIPNPLNKRVVNHKDGNKQNNHTDNLEWATHSENLFHAYATNLRKRPSGELSSTAKLTNDQVNYIRVKLLGKNTVQQIADKYDVGETTIRNIKNNKTWKI